MIMAIAIDDGFITPETARVDNDDWKDIRIDCSMLNNLTITYARAGSAEGGRATTIDIRLECGSQVCHLGILN